MQQDSRRTLMPTFTGRGVLRVHLYGAGEHRRRMETAAKLAAVHDPATPRAVWFQADPDPEAASPRVQRRPFDQPALPVSGLEHLDALPEPVRATFGAVAEKPAGEGFASDSRLPPGLCAGIAALGLGPDAGGERAEVGVQSMPLGGFHGLVHLVRDLQGALVVHRSTVKDGTGEGHTPRSANLGPARDPGGHDTPGVTLCTSLTNRATTGVWPVIRLWVFTGEGGCVRRCQPFSGRVRKQ
ncbi:hypothetical protein ACIGXA_39835 [Streptomyces fildesensis]|uniref:Uncharacterized protein n=1 Tax=Streptomyces fildesensis TaxID=375757 RepID=A0ABW8CMP4_9ACTN